MPVYSQFLKGIHKLSLHLGGRNAPFQYILTTTSEPPQALKEDGTVRLELRAHPEQDMLFCRILEPPTLFDEEKVDNDTDSDIDVEEESESDD